jgi:hypothetical protein
VPITNNGNGAWQQKHPPIAPSPRGLAATAWDPVRHGVVLFGGAAVTAYNDTWLWKSGAWTQLTAPTVPPIRYAFGMAYDPRAKGVVMYGGYGSLYASNDLWTLESDIVPGVNVTPISLNFGELVVGSGHAVETIAVTNNGGNPLTMTAVNFVWTNNNINGQFIVSGQGQSCSTSSPNTSCAPPPACVTLAPGASCAIPVEFAFGFGLTTANATINFANGVPPVSVSLTGTGVGIGVTPQGLIFGPVPAGTTVRQTVTLQNTGPYNVVVNSGPFFLDVNGTCNPPPFTVSGLTLPLSLPPTKSITFNVAFSPSGTACVFVISFGTNDPMQPQVGLTVVGQ